MTYIQYIQLISHEEGHFSPNISTIYIVSKLLEGSVYLYIYTHYKVKCELDWFGERTELAFTVLFHHLVL